MFTSIDLEPVQTRIFESGKPLDSSASEWSQRDDFSYWADHHTYDSEGSQDAKRWSSHPHSSITHLQESKPLYRTSSFPEQQRQLQHQLQHRSSEPVPNWFDQQFYDIQTADDDKRWSSHPHSSISHIEGPKPLYRTSSHPDKRQELPRFSSEPTLAPKSSFTSYPPPGGRSHQLAPNHSTGQLNLPFSGGAHMTLPSQNRSNLFNSSLHLGGSKYEPHFSGNLAQFNTGSPLNNRIQNQWVNQTGLYPGDNSNLLNNMLQQQLYHNNGSVSPHLLSQLQQQQHRLHHPVQQSAGLISGLQPHLFNHHLSSGSSIGRKYEHVLGDVREHRQKSTRRHRFSQQASNASSQKIDSGSSLQFRSKYMTSDEIESILKMQLAAVTHCNDPYIDDYYHQARLAKQPSEVKFKLSFCPTKIKDVSSRARANTEPHGFLQVDALGRVSYVPIRQPRPLLEVDPPNSSASGGSERIISEKSLEQEPLFAARITIEDGLCLLLDVDDIDRFLQCNLLQDGGTQFLRRRNVLLEGLATSLHLVDPLGKNGHKAGLAAKDDLVFLRLASISKGRKLLAKYLRLLAPGSELMRIGCMAIFRHLRFLFGSIPPDSAAAETTSDLAMVVCQCVQGMDLGSLGACLAAVVCSSEQPPLRPLGSPAGDSASLVLVSVLKSATDLLTDPHAASNNKLGNRTFWQASFDEFFGLLTKYCMNKYQNIMQSREQNVAALGSDADNAGSKEMPVDLLRASLPHTNDRQRKLLLDFAQRSAPVVGFNSYAGSSSSHVNSETVLS
ncbi:hypothetical protein L195_g003354 [Trifolium pratense]|uniref:Protein PAT1 1-like n=1 Tax=Trifolium pratense TaxID=57577 RepID=A0A2K3NV10_TRIPR|nr:hypothetical protein L195_g003354 [Trifolium pratense]